VTRRPGVHPVMECTQNIPCNPCQDACPKKCIKIGEKITSLPAVDESATCVGCGMCVASCSGQSIFLVEEDVEEGYGEVTMPYEFLPLPKVGDRGIALGRNGKYVCDAEVTKIRTAPVFDHTYLLTIKVTNDMVMKARFYKKEMAKEA
jgi:Fe-S-cluster-containing hydrogenase component 2